MKNYIFDLYGTLIDIQTDEENGAFWQKMCEYYNDFGTHYSPEGLKKAYYEYCREEVKKLPGDYPEIRLEKVFMRLLEEAGGKAPMDLYEWALITASYFRGASRSKLTPYPGARELLKELKRQEKRVFLLSNAQTCFTVDEMLKCKMSFYFDAVYISSDYGIKKPDPAFMNILLNNEHLKVAESVMIGNDLTSDIKVAQAVGMKSIFINSYHHSEKQLQEEAACLGDYHDYRQVASIEALYNEIKKDEE